MLKIQENGTVGEDSRPTIEEAYATASASGQGFDVLGAAGMSHSMVGGALIRLRGEWDASAIKPVLEPGSAASKLRSLTVALAQVQVLAIRRGIAPQCAPEVLRWWLAPHCEACRGRRRMPRSLNACNSCSGKGERDAPYGKAGAKLVACMEEAINDWRSLTKKKLRGA